MHSMQSEEIPNIIQPQCKSIVQMNCNNLPFILEKKQILFKYPNVKYDQSKVQDKVADPVKKDSAGADPNLQ